MRRKATGLRTKWFNIRQGFWRCAVGSGVGLHHEVVILGGGVGSHSELCRVTQRMLERNEFAQPRLRSSSLGTQAQLHGAIYLSLAASEVRLLA